MSNPRRPADTGRSKYTKQDAKRPFRFPLCLLSFSDDREQLAQHIISYCLIEQGLWQIRKQGKRLADKAGRTEGDLRYESAEMCAARYGYSVEVLAGHLASEGGQRLTREETIFALSAVERSGEEWHPHPDFKPYVWWHLAYAVSIAKKKNHRLASYAEGSGEEDMSAVGGLDLNVNSAHLDSTFTRWTRAAAHVETYRQRTGSGSMYVSVQRRAVWALNPGGSDGLSIREFSILAAIYAGLRERKWGAVSLSWIQYLADGFSSEERFLDWHRAEGAAAVDPGDVPLPSSAETGSRGEAKGLYRYDRARSFYLQARDQVGAFDPETGVADVSYDVEDFGEMFEPLLTQRGLLFELREPFRDHGNLPLGDTPEMTRDFTEGERVVWLPKTPSGGLFVGTIRAASGKRRLFDVERGGEVYHISRSGSNMAPAAFLPDGSEQDRGPSDTVQPEPRYGIEQIRRTRDRLRQLGFFAMASDGRSTYYGRGLEQADLEDKVFEKQAHKVRAKARKTKQRAVNQARLDALRAELDAEQSAAVRVALGETPSETANKRDHDGSETTRHRQSNGTATPNNEMPLGSDASHPRDAITADPHPANARSASRASSAGRAPGFEGDGKAGEEPEASGVLGGAFERPSSRHETPRPSWLPPDALHSTEANSEYTRLYGSEFEEGHGGPGFFAVFAPLFDPLTGQQSGWWRRKTEADREDTLS